MRCPFDWLSVLVDDKMDKIGTVLFDKMGIAAESKAEGTVKVSRRMDSLIQITVVVENTVAMSFRTGIKQGLLGEHGLALLIEMEGRRWLFDTGRGKALMPNMEVLGIEADSIDGLIISHTHMDHFGSMRALLEKRSLSLPIYAHPSFFARRYKKVADKLQQKGVPWLREELETLGAQFVLQSEPGFLAPTLWISGEIPRRWDFEALGDKYYIDEGSKEGPRPDILMDDQSLVLLGKNGAWIVTGCAHAGICNVISYFKEQFPGKRICGVIGGLHLYQADLLRIEKTSAIMKENSLALLAVGHCTGTKESWQLATSLDIELTPLNTGETLRLE